MSLPLWPCACVENLRWVTSPREIRATDFDVGISQRSITKNSHLCPLLHMYQRTQSVVRNGWNKTTQRCTGRFDLSANKCFGWKTAAAAGVQARKPNDKLYLAPNFSPSSREKVGGKRKSRRRRKTAEKSKWSRLNGQRQMCHSRSRSVLPLLKALSLAHSLCLREGERKKATGPVVSHSHQHFLRTDMRWRVLPSP